MELVLHQHNPFTTAYRHMYDVKLEQNCFAKANAEEPPNMRMYLLEGRQDPTRPQHEEVAAVYVSNENGPPGWEMIIHPSNACLQYLRKLLT